MTTPWLFLDFDNTLMGTEQYALPSLIERFNRLYQHELDHLLTLQEFKAHFHGQSRETLCQKKHGIKKYAQIDHTIGKVLRNNNRTVPF